MYAKALLVASAFTSLVASQGISNDDYPETCTDDCSPITFRSNSCDAQFDNDDDTLNCICTGPSMMTQIPACASCVSNNGNSDDDDDSSGMSRSPA